MAVQSVRGQVEMIQDVLNEAANTTDRGIKIAKLLVAMSWLCGVVLEMDADNRYAANVASMLANGIQPD